MPPFMRPFSKLIDCISYTVHAGVLNYVVPYSGESSEETKVHFEEE